MPSPLRALPLASLLAACAPDRATAPGAPDAPGAPALAVSALGPLTRVAPAEPGEAYAIALRLSPLPDPRLEAPVRRAAARWTRVLGAGLTPYRVDLTDGACGAGTPPVHEVVRDLLVLVRFAELDGEGGMLGTARPCVLRPDDAPAGAGLPIVGIVTLDVDDAVLLADTDRLARLGDVAAHEIGHALGVGSLWAGGEEEEAASPFVPLLGVARADLHYVGPAGVAASAALGFTAAGAPVPVENGVGGAARGTHWRERVYGDEVMTGWVGDGPNALSALSVGALADLGYAVRPEGAEPLAPPAAGGPPRRGDAARVRIVERVLRPRFSGSGGTASR